MKFLVTGATAFAGCHLTNLLLKDGHEVWCTSRRTNGSETDVLDITPVEQFQKIKWVFCDLLNKRSCFDLMEANRFDGIFHLAAQSHPPTSFKLPFYTQDINIQGTLNLLEGMANFQDPDTRFMFCSTSEVYGAPALRPGQGISEGWPIATVNPYASSKAAMDIFLQERINNNYIDGFITRAFSHTGPKRGKIFSVSSDAYQIARIKAGAQDSVIQVGNLSSQRAVMDVRDCVRAYYRLMMNGSKGVFNVGAENCYSMGDLLDIMLSISGLRDVKIEINPDFWRPIDIPIQRPDTQKIREEIGWSPTIPIEETLADLLAYWDWRIKASEPVH